MTLPPARTSLSAAVFFALYGVPHLAASQQLSEGPPKPLAEVTVTANRREQTLEAVPYSLTAVGADEIARTGVTDLVSLASQVPGLSMYDFGIQNSASVFPIIRGLNASSASTGFRTFEQAPVGTYIDNSPIDGYFQLVDIQRVEVLRGPQGTLYGAGTLGGALRIIPNAPELQSLSGDVEIGGGMLAHSSGKTYRATVTLNVPVGDTLAFRVSGKYAYEPGFVNVYGILARGAGPSGGIPLLANPADPVNSPGVFTAKNDWNDQRTFTGRASLLWKPVDRFNAQLAFTYSKATGNGGPTVNQTFPGGPYKIDPRVNFPSGGDYQFFSASEDPFSFKNELTSLDMSYDAGFATLSSTSSYYTTDGSSAFDATYNLANFPTFVGYYAGQPLNPRYVNPVALVESSHTFTQEVRLVSNTGPDKHFDYVVGVFYEDQTRNGGISNASPGSPEYSVAQGCTSPLYYNYPSGPYSSLPNCLLVTGPNDVYFSQFDTQRFKDKSEFGELTWHVTSRGQITFGGRHFSQSFTDVQSYVDYPFATFIPPAPRGAPASKNTWKINPSYEYATNQYVYALWSQGFRRGGANAIPQNPPSFLGERNLSLLTYAPDSTNNYEVGIKGRFDNGISYTFDGFDVHWNNPQVAGQTPVGNWAVWNAKKARSTGAEFDLNSPLVLHGLSANLSAAYADARFTEDYLIKGPGTQLLDAGGNISAGAGQQLPGSPKTSAAATISYQRALAPDYNLDFSLNDTYRSPMVLSTFALIGGVPPQRLSGMNIANLSASVSHHSLRLGVYVTNLADRRVIQSSSVFSPGNLSNSYFINQPREIDLRLRYSF